MDGDFKALMDALEEDRHETLAFNFFQSPSIRLGTCQCNMFVLFIDIFVDLGIYYRVQIIHRVDTCRS